MTVDTATQTAEPIVWHRLPTHEHHARRGRRLVGLVTRPAAGVFWAHRISWSPDTDTVDEHGPKTRHRTLTAARAAVELSAPDGSPPPDKHKDGSMMQTPNRSWQPFEDGPGAMRTGTAAIGRNNSQWDAVVDISTSDGTITGITGAVLSRADGGWGAPIAAVTPVRPAVYDFEEDETVGVSETMWACETVLARIDAHGLIPRRRVHDHCLFVLRRGPRRSTRDCLTAGRSAAG